MGRILLGLLKGGLLGAAAGYFAGSAGVSAGPIAVVLYAAIGAAVGLVCGRPLWRQETFWTPVIKALFGVGVGVGLFFLARKVLGHTVLSIAAIPGSGTHPLAEVPALLGPIIGAVYGIFVEVDDGSSAGSPVKAPATKR
jgi:hypothetical protein